VSSKSIDRLIFVFAADAGKISAFVDTIKKVLMLKGCALCAITHGTSGEKEEWKLCRETLGVPLDYVHRDELTPDLEATVGGEVPCILAKTGDELVRLVGSQVLERCKGSVADLRGRLYYHAAMNGLALPLKISEDV
jgi:hypothetical protein